MWYPTSETKCFLLRYLSVWTCQLQDVMFDGCIMKGKYIGRAVDEPGDNVEVLGSHVDHSHATINS